MIELKKNQLTEYLKELKGSPNGENVNLKGIIPETPNPYLTASEKSGLENPISVIKEWTELIRSINELMNTEPINSVIKRLFDNPAVPSPQPIKNLNPYTLVETGQNSIKSDEFTIKTIMGFYKEFLTKLYEKKADITVKELLPYFDKAEIVEPLEAELKKRLKGE